MGFYEEISKYYDYIFPAGEAQTRFIKDSAGAPGKKVLDVACGSGEYTVQLAKAGYKVAAVDLDEAMVLKAKEKIKAEGVSADVFESNMLELSEKLQPGYDCVFCIGNSIVHLGDTDEILKAVKQMHSLLSPGGSLVLQIINYDRIIKFGVNELPAIKNDDIGLEFIRKYILDRDTGKIHFNTVLTVQNREIQERYENTIPLYPLLGSDMEKVLKEAGFQSYQFYGDFSSAPYNESSYMLVVKAEK